MEQLHVGEGRALDLAKYFIAIVNQIGSGLSSSPSNTAAPFNGPHFPKVRIGDDVRAQHRLLTEKFGITQLALVFGGSMGAQQTYEWAVAYPGFVKRAAALAGTARNPAHTVLMAEVIAGLFAADPAFRQGHYADSAALHVARRQHATYFSAICWCPAFFANETWRGLGFSSLDDFIGGFMHAFWRRRPVRQLRLSGARGCGAVDVHGVRCKQRLNAAPPTTSCQSSGRRTGPRPVCATTASPPPAA